MRKINLHYIKVFEWFFLFAIYNQNIGNNEFLNRFAVKSNDKYQNLTQTLPVMSPTMTLERVFLMIFTKRNLHCSHGNAHDPQC